MFNETEVYDVIIIGAGPNGHACAIESKKQNLNYLVIDKGCLVNSIFHFPTNVILFSTPDLLEIGGLKWSQTAIRFTIPILLKQTSQVIISQVKLQEEPMEAEYSSKIHAIMEKNYRTY